MSENKILQIVALIFIVISYKNGYYPVEQIGVLPIIFLLFFLHFILEDRQSAKR